MPLQVLPVLDDVYCLYRRSYFNCTYLLKRPDRVVLIDAGMQTDGRDAFDALRRLGLEHMPVTDILITHWHSDHTAGASAVRARYGSTTWAHAADADELEGDAIDENSWRWRLAARLPESGVLVLAKGLLGQTLTTPVMVDRRVSDGDEVADGLRALHTPGHSDGHVSYFDERTGVLFAGDALAVVDGRLRRMAKTVTLDLEQAKASMRKLLAVPCRAIAPGHREALVENVDEERKRFGASLDAAWPYFG